MQARGGGSIINISSIHSLMSQPTNMLYAGTKGAMNAAARVMALDYAKDNIRVNTICPGVVISDVMYDDMDKLDDAGKKQLDAALHRCQPLEPGRMQDIANTALFFASNMSANITGQTLLSDGGTSIKAHDMDC
ncbi:MAG: SDR family oxidoreductase, partial [Gemmiger qucibialis]